MCEREPGKIRLRVAYIQRSARSLQKLITVKSTAAGGRST